MGVQVMGYDFKVQFKPDISNKAADAMSRHPNFLNTNFNAISTCCVDWQILKEEILRDLTLSIVQAELEKNGGKVSRFLLHYRCLLFINRMAMSSSSTIIDKLLHEHHKSALRGHNGDYKTYLRLATRWFWEGMRKTVAQYVRRCLICQKQKTSHQQPAGLL